MTTTEIDLLQYKDDKEHFFISFLYLLASLAITYALYLVIVSCIWANYKGNWQNYYQVTSSMVFFVIAIFWAVFVVHKLNLRIPLYFTLAFFSILVYLNNVSPYIRIIDMIISIPLDAISTLLGHGRHSDEIFLIKDFIGNAFYEALVTWVIIDVPCQILENRQINKWETSVKDVYYSISNQIMFLVSINNDIGSIHIKSNQVHSNIIESFCKKKIKYYPWYLKFFPKKWSPYKQDLQIKNQYKHLLSLLQDIHSNPNNLNGHEYLRLLYETETIFKRSKIINSSYSE